MSEYTVIAVPTTNPAVWDGKQFIQLPISQNNTMDKEAQKIIERNLWDLYLRSGDCSV